jgi:hypothetical protein
VVEEGDVGDLPANAVGGSVEELTANRVAGDANGCAAKQVGSLVDERPQAAWAARPPTALP